MKTSFIHFWNEQVQGIEGYKLFELETKHAILQINPKSDPLSPTKSSDVDDKLHHSPLVEFCEVKDFFKGILWAHDQICFL